MYYFDNAATTRVLPQAAEAAVDCMTQTYGNPSSLHRMGVQAEQVISRARRALAGVLGCREGEVYFTSGATESSNIALLGAAQAKRRAGNKILTTQIEHASVSHTMQELARRGFCIVEIPSRGGKYHAEDFLQAADEQTILVSCMYVNNETGLILPVNEIASGLKARFPNALMHVDAVQAFCKLPFRVGTLGADLVSVSAHKIHGPKGIGALYVKSGIKLPSHSFGGKHEKGLRPGTEAAPSIAAFGVAAAQMSERIEQNAALYQSLNHQLRGSLGSLPGIEFNSPADGAPHILSLSAVGVRSEIMLHFLESKGFCVSSGSACSKGAKSGVLPALGLSKAREDSAIRVSFSHENTAQQAALLCEAIEQGLRSILRAGSSNIR